MQTRDEKVVYVRMPGDLADSLSIMAGVFGITSGEYIRQAVEGKLSEDVPDNLTAYNAIRQAREKQAQEKGGIA